MKRTAHRAIGALLALVVALSSLASGPPASAQSAGATLSSTPASIDETIALGSARRLDLVLSNSGNTALSLRLFEGRVTPAQLRRKPDPALARVALPSQPAKIDPQLKAALDAPGERADFLVFLGDQADLSAAYAMTDWNARGDYVYRTLREHAEHSQTGLRALLQARGLRASSLWVVNALLVHDGRQADLDALAGRAEVAVLRANRLTARDEPVPDDVTLDQLATCDADADNVCWNVAAIGAERVWSNYGVRGQGVVVANVDSGVNYTHPALVGQYRGSRGDGSFDHNYNWFDAYGGLRAPIDSGDHGTHTMGTMVAAGSAGPGSPAVGVAPGAHWVAARACSATTCTESDLIEAAQWMLAPTDINGANPRPDRRPQVVNNSWSVAGGSNWYAGYTNAWRAAGIFPVFAAGNSGNLSGCGSIQSPADYSGVVGVGAVDKSQQLTLFSSIGPTVDGRLKPDLTAPGSGVLSTANSAEYRVLNGTSMATPHVAATVALVWSANPELIGDYEQTYQILTASAEPRIGDLRYEDQAHGLCQPVSSPNNIYGYGTLDAYAAVTMATVDVPWLSLGASLSEVGPGDTQAIGLTLDARKVPGPGTYQARVLVHNADLSQAPLIIPLTLRVPADASQATVGGTVTRAVDGAPLVAMVEVQGGPAVATDSAGRFSITLASAETPYLLTATAFDYRPASARLTLAPGAMVSRSFALELDSFALSAGPAPPIAQVPLGDELLLNLPIRNNSSRPISYTLALETDAYGVWRSDDPGGPAGGWTTPPPGATSLSLLDDSISERVPIGFAFPFYGTNYTSLQISANGFLSLSMEDLPREGASFIESCLPLPETGGPAIVPLRIDLNPARGGRVSYASTTDGFLVSWDDVPLFGSAERSASFQVLLRPDGRIAVHYKDVGDLDAGDNLVYGLQRTAHDAQMLACVDPGSLADGLSLELRPQQRSDLWLRLTEEAGLVDAGQTANLRIGLRWTPPIGDWPLVGRLVLRSINPLRPSQTIDLGLRVRMQPAVPAEQLFLPFAPTGAP